MLKLRMIVKPEPDTPLSTYLSSGYCYTLRMSKRTQASQWKCICEM